MGRSDTCPWKVLWPNYDKTREHSEITVSPSWRESLLPCAEGWIIVDQRMASTRTMVPMTTLQSCHQGSLGRGCGMLFFFLAQLWMFRLPHFLCRIAAISQFCSSESMSSKQGTQGGSLLFFWELCVANFLLIITVIIMSKCAEGKISCSQIVPSQLNDLILFFIECIQINKKSWDCKEGFHFPKIEQTPETKCQPLLPLDCCSW